jgi:hypothetical protein
MANAIVGSIIMIVGSAVAIPVGILGGLTWRWAHPRLPCWSGSPLTS